MKKELIELRVNGRTHEIAVEPSKLLLDVLREELGLTGAAVGDTITGQRLISGLKTTLISSLSGGQGLGSLGVLGHEFEVIHQKADFHVSEVNAEFVRQALLDFGELLPLGNPFGDGALLRVIKVHRLIRSNSAGLTSRIQLIFSSKIN